MFTGYQFEVAHEIHQDRLRRAERKRLQATAAGNQPSRIGKWTTNALEGLKRLHPFGTGGRAVKAYKFTR